MYRMLIAFIALVILSSCSSENSPAPSKNSEGSTPEKVVMIDGTDGTTENRVERKKLIYARVGKEEISQADIDKILELQLFDLEWVKYDLRRQTLAKLISEKTKDGITSTSSVDVFIEPPMPPRLALDVSDKQPSHGEKLAPITMAIFCSYPSVHCANMTKTYDELMAAYPEQLRLVFFDYPQAFHFNAGHAARAARCANKGGQFWPYHKGLLANFDQISDTLFMNLARQVNLDMTGFKACFESDEFTNEVKDNLQQAEVLGLSKVPVTLINGLFINGPRSFDTMRYFIDKEFVRLNIIPAYKLQQTKTKPANQPAKQQVIPISQLPLRLEAITLGANAEHSSAIIQHLKDETSSSYKYDDEILPNIFLVMIDSNSVVLEHAGKLERIMLTAGQDQSLLNDEESIVDNSDGSAPNELALLEEDRNQRGKSLADPDPEDIPAGLEYTFRGVVSPKGETPLSRSWLTEQLVEREALKSHFEPAEHEVEGMHVMRLSNIQENDFYQTLGLQERDVVLRVNNEWVHSGQNGLFDSLENKQEVSVVLMRKGLPVHLNYHIN
tara:strand:- start:9349 stop:11016 length:1668 start_codon:yes stop_codon:yes gene_type:complete